MGRKGIYAVARPVGNAVAAGDLKHCATVCIGLRRPGRPC
jgi:hypothetical protein